MSGCSCGREHAGRHGRRLSGAEMDAMADVFSAKDPEPIQAALEDLAVRYTVEDAEAFLAGEAQKR